ncbi:MAG: hypothetical protein QOK11_2297, partial [Pseudonocardiales bacterium]|nr:hypothetical protein [Pseudonocardiales bacterium]
SALRLVHLMAARLWVLEPGMRLWQLPLLLDDELARSNAAAGPG